MSAPDPLYDHADYQGAFYVEVWVPHPLRETFETFVRRRLGDYPLQDCELSQWNAKWRDHSWAMEWHLPQDAAIQLARFALHHGLPVELRPMV